MRKLLIADYNEEFRTALAAALQKQYHVLCCKSGTEALTILYQEHPDILVLDLMLPELTFRSLVQEWVTASMMQTTMLLLMLTPSIPDMKISILRGTATQQVSPAAPPSVDTQKHLWLRLPSPMLRKARCSGRLVKA